MCGHSKRENREILLVSTLHRGDATCLVGRSENVSDGTADMNANRKSDESVLPSTSANNDVAETSAESIEERDSAKRNVDQTALLRTPGRIQCKSRGLHGVREAARKDSKLKFTALLHHVNEDCLTESFFNLKKTAAVGVDEVTWHDTSKTWRPTLLTFTEEFTGEPTVLSLLAECGFLNPMAASDHWALHRSRTRSFKKRFCGFCKVSTNKTFSVSAMVFGLVVANMIRSMRCMWRSPAKR